MSPGQSGPCERKAPALGPGKKLLFSLATCLALFASVEIGWRLVIGWHNHWLDSHRWHPTLGWCLRENWAGREGWTGGFCRINARGIRDDRPIHSKKPGEKRLLVLGDSIAFGVTVPTEQTYPAQLEQELHRQGHEWRVLNGGVTGYDSSQEADWLELYGWRLDPDALAIEYCTNDGDLSVRDHPDRRHQIAGQTMCWLTEHSIVAFKLQHSIWYVQGLLGLATATVPVREEKKHPGTILVGWSLIEVAYRKIARQARPRQVPVVLLLYPSRDLLRGRGEDRTPRLQALAKELGWRVIDLRPVFADNPASLFLPGDPIHPNAAGYQRAAGFSAAQISADGLLDDR